MPSLRCRRSSSAIFSDEVADSIDELTDAMHVVGREARTIEGRLSKEQWIVGASYSAADMVIFPWIQLLRRALNKAAAAELGARFLPMETKLSGARALDRAHRVAPRLRARPTRRIGANTERRAGSARARLASRPPPSRRPRPET